MHIRGSFERIIAGPKVAAWIGKLDAFFIKLPHLPKKVRVFLNRIIPFFALVVGIIGLIAVLITSFFLVLALLAWDTAALLPLLGAFGLVLFDTMLLLKAFKPLRSGNAIGWIYLFWAQVLETLNFIIQIITGEAQFLGGIVALVIGYYLLFEIGQFYVYKTENSRIKPTISPMR